MKSLLLSLAAVGLLSGTALAQDVCAPAKVTTLATTVYYGAIFISWNATGDDCTTGNATTYELRVSASPRLRQRFRQPRRRVYTARPALRRSEPQPQAAAHLKAADSHVDGTPSGRRHVDVGA